MSNFWSVVPPLVAIGLAILTRRVFFSLFTSIWVGGMILTGGDPFAAVGASFDWIKDVMIDPWNARFLVLILLLGSGASFMFKAGGSHSLTRALERWLTTRRRVQLLTWILGVTIFFNDYVNSVIVGNATRNINAKFKVSKEKLAYLIDATAAPVATIGPVSDWIGFQVSLIAAAFVALNLEGEQPYFAFLRSIPWNFYCMLTLFAVPTIVTGKDFGPMAKAELRAMKTGKLIADGDTPLSSVESDLGEPFDLDRSSIWSFILPLVTLIGIGMWALWYTGGGASGKSPMDALADADVSIALSWAAFAMTVVGLVFALRQGMSLRECEKTLLTGFGTMLPALIIMVLAWSIGSVCESLGTAEYVIDLTRDWMTPGLLPFLIFVLSMFVAFATGTSWGTMAIMTPIGIPLAHTVGGLPLVYITIGAVFSGAIFGDHCSPISDTPIMASIFSGSDHIAHIRTQIPYGLVTAAISGLLYLFASAAGSAFILLLVGIPCQFFILRFLGNRYQKKHFDQKDIALLNNTI